MRCTRKQDFRGFAAKLLFSGDEKGEMKRLHQEQVFLWLSGAVKELLLAVLFSISPW